MTSSARSCFQLLTGDLYRGRIGPGWNPKAQRPGLQSCRTVEGQGGRYNSLKLGLACANEGPVPQFVVSLGAEGDWPRRRGSSHGAESCGYRTQRGRPYSTETPTWMTKPVLRRPRRFRWPACRNATVRPVSYT